MNIKRLFHGRTVRRHILFEGEVQMVGFRYHAWVAAHERKLGGYVKNLDDGRVEMEAEGEERLIKEVLRELKGKEHIRIDRMEITEMEVKGEQEFHVIDQGEIVDLYYQY